MSDKRVDLVIIVPPAGSKNTVYPPYGAMYIASACLAKGYGADIIDADSTRLANAEIIDRIREMDPRYIGLSGIVAPSYNYIKKLSFELRGAFPDKKQILGGGLSSAAEAILDNTSVDIVVKGEGDRTITDLLEHLDRGADIGGVKGIHFKKGPEHVFTGHRELIGKLDELPYPAFDLVDMDKYMPDGVEFIRNFTTKIKDRRIYDKGRKRKMVTIPTSRGCFGECSFCFRAYPGIRAHSMKYVFDLIEHCIDKYDAGFFTFGDECFAPSKARNWEFIEEYRRRRLDIVFRILGMRVDTVDKEILKAYKEIGCWMIEYGFESGSQKMLNIINKRVTVEQNRQAALWTAQAGMFTSPALVLAMPGETDRTITETIDFLKSLNFDYKQYQWKYALPIPGSALYDFARLSGAIKDEDEYLSSLTKEVDKAGIFHVNLTDEPDDVVASWDGRLKREMDEHYFKRVFGNRYLAGIGKFVMTLDIYRRRNALRPAILAKLRKILSGTGKTAGKPGPAASHPRFRKDPVISTEKLLAGIDHSAPNRAAALKSLNKRIEDAKV